MSFKVVKPGLQTCIQDYPGRIGYWNQGFPPSGPMDSWSFRLANLLVGNNPGAPGLEIQLIGPTLCMERDCVVAITGADVGPTLDGRQIHMWTSIGVKKGQLLATAMAKSGARAYIAFSGGIDAPLLLGSSSTFHGAQIGGIDGGALKKDQKISVREGAGSSGWTVPKHHRPPITGQRTWSIEVVRGPNDDWVDAAGHERFLQTDWKLSSRSGRSGYRLEGPDWTFAEKAYDKGPEHGAEPSNILDQGYPLGGINLGGQTPIILVHDAPSMGGFICPYTVPTCAFWKLGQSKPGDIYRFDLKSVEEAQELREVVEQHCVLTNLDRPKGCADN